MALAMTIIEGVAGEYCLRVMKVKLWDYSDCWGNIDSVICPLFSFFWGILGVFYFYAIHPFLETVVVWLMAHPLYTFFIGMFYGVFLIDLAYSGHIITKIKNFAKAHGVIVEIEKFKKELSNLRRQHQNASHFLLSYHSNIPISLALAQFFDNKKEVLQKHLTHHPTDQANHDPH